MIDYYFLPILSAFEIFPVIDSAAYDKAVKLPLMSTNAWKWRCAMTFFL